MNRINALYNSHPLDYKKYKFNDQPSASAETDTAPVSTWDRATISLEARQLAATLSPTAAKSTRLPDPTRLTYNPRTLRATP